MTECPPMFLLVCCGIPLFVVPAKDGQYELTPEESERFHAVLNEHIAKRHQIGEPVTVLCKPDHKCPDCHHPSHSDRVCGYAKTETFKDDIGWIGPPSGEEFTTIVGTCQCQGNPE